MNNKTKSSMKSILYLLVSLLMTLPAHAASFDCAKAASKVEKLVCETPAISKLDDELGKLYQNVLGKANDEQKNLLVTEQKHWLKYTRNVCKDETCLKLAYWSRQAGLGTFFEPKSPLYEHEADKAEAIKQVLSAYPMYLSYNPEFCDPLMEDLKQMKGIRFVDPVVQTQSYEDPALDKWKKNCEALPPPNFHYQCERNITPGSIAEAVEVCNVGYGLPPFKLYELPPVGQSAAKRYVFYTDDGFGPMNRDWKKPSLGGGFAGFQQINLANCKPVGHAFADESKGESNGTNYMGNVFSNAGQGGRNGKNYNSIIEYKKQYYFLVLNNNDSPSWWLYIDSVLPNGSKAQKSCFWSPVAPKSN